MTNSPHHTSERLSPDEVPSTTTVRRFRARSTGLNNGSTWVIGPVLAEVHVRTWEHSYRASYAVHVDGRHQFGGCADHLDSEGLPKGPPVVDWTELRPELPAAVAALAAETDAYGFATEGYGELPEPEGDCPGCAGGGATPYDDPCPACNGSGEATGLEGTERVALLRTSELHAGDLVYAHGMRLRLGEITEYAGNGPAWHSSAVVLNLATLEAAAKADPQSIEAFLVHRIREHRGRWTVQGNRLAMWTVAL